MTKKWTFLSHHSHVLIALDQDADTKIEELAAILGVTSRSVVNVLNDLVEGGYLTKSKLGRRNRYSINKEAKLRHATSGQKSVGDLISSLGEFH
jgi:DNA-binding MarR family transcriptional regulator